MASAVFQPGRTALISGGASGVGYAFATLCQKYGMNVALVDKSSEGLAKAREALTTTARNGQKAEIYEMDVSSLTQWRGLKQEVEAKFGGSMASLPFCQCCKARVPSRQLSSLVQSRESRIRQAAATLLIMLAKRL